jgi:chemotaxis protein MotA
MFSLIGMAVVIGAIIGGYLMEHGQLGVLFQPAELVIIGGSALGTILIANPLPTVIRMFKALLAILGGDRSKASYLEALKMLYDLFGHARKNGLPKLEADVDDPKKSAVFSKYPKFLADHHSCAFVCDTLRMFVSGGVDPFEINEMMEGDMEVHHHEAMEPISALSTTADALPGLGIVAAVLGVCITMGAIGGPPEEIGHKVAAALVGTFLGILLCYGFLGPLSSRIGKFVESDGKYYNVLRVGLMAFIKGAAPIMAVEFARRAVPSSVRPSFKELEDSCRNGGKAAPAAAA